MRVDCALLCDAVTVREGLLHILGGGVTRLYRPTFPAPLGLAMALRVMIHPTEAKQSHNLKLLLLDQDGGQIAEVQLAFQAGEVGGDIKIGEELALALPLSMQAVGIPKAGQYSFELLIDGIHQVAVPFYAEVGGAPQIQAPPPPPPRPRRRS